MKKYILLFILCFLYINTFSQSVYKVIQGYNLIKPSAKIQETITVSQSLLNVTLQRAYFQTQYRESTNIKISYLENVSRNAVVKVDIEQFKCEPTELYGSYNYLKTCYSLMNLRTLKKIRKTSGYNGVHHIINQSTIRVIYEKYIKTNDELKEIPNLQEILENTPAIFHPLHNNKAYIDTFHNSEKQLIIYEEYGVEGIIMNFFYELIDINKTNHISEIDQEIVTATLMQAYIWAKTYGLKWN